MTRRTEKIAEAIKRLTSRIIHEDLRDPRITGFVTITKVEVTPGLRLAKIYYSVFGDEKKKKLVRAGLKSARNFMRRYIVNELKLRYAVDIVFEIDESQEFKEKIDEILDQIHKEKGHEEDRRNTKSD